MKEYGLVLAGGGAKGAYQLGAWKALRELGIKFSAVVGVSIGSINGAFVSADSYDDAAALWDCASVDRGVKITEELKDPENLFSFKNFPALFKEIIKNGGIDASPTKELLEQFVDEKKVRASEIRFGMVAFMLSSMSPLEIFIDKIPEGELIDYLLASSKVPGVSKIGPEGERYLDGGIYDNAPIEMLRKNGYNRMIVIDISTMKGVGHRTELSGAEIIYIRPYNIDDLGAAFDFSEETHNRRVTMGYLDTRRVFGYLSGRQFYFEKKVFRNMVDEFGADACEQLESIAAELGLDKLKIYNKDDFLADLKVKYLEYLEEERVKELESEQKFYSPLLKMIPHFKSGNEYSEARAVLDSLII